MPTPLIAVLQAAAFADSPHAHRKMVEEAGAAPTTPARAANLANWCGHLTIRVSSVNLFCTSTHKRICYEQEHKARIDIRKYVYCECRVANDPIFLWLSFPCGTVRTTPGISSVLNFFSLPTTTRYCDESFYSDLRDQR